MATTPRQQVWESMLDADYRTRYFGALATLYRRRQRRLNLALALLSSSAFVVLAVRIGAGLELPWLAETAALLAAIFGWFLALGRFSERSTLAASLLHSWGDLHTRYTELWLSLEEMADNEVLSRWHTIEADHGGIDETASSEFSYKRRLARRVYAEMVSSLAEAA